MASNECKCEDELWHAKAVESSIFQSLMNIYSQPDREDYWRNHADLLERKFTTGHGKHYSLVIEALGRKDHG